MRKRPRLMGCDPWGKPWCLCEVDVRPHSHGAGPSALVIPRVPEPTRRELRAVVREAKLITQSDSGV